MPKFKYPSFDTMVAKIRQSEFNRYLSVLDWIEINQTYKNNPKQFYLDLAALKTFLVERNPSVKEQYRQDLKRVRKYDESEPINQFKSPVFYTFFKLQLTQINQIHAGANLSSEERELVIASQLAISKYLANFINQNTDMPLIFIEGKHINLYYDTVPDRLKEEAKQVFGSVFPDGFERNLLTPRQEAMLIKHCGPQILLYLGKLKALYGAEMWSYTEKLLQRKLAVSDSIAKGGLSEQANMMFFEREKFMINHITETAVQENQTKAVLVLGRMHLLDITLQAGLKSFALPIELEYNRIDSIPIPSKYMSNLEKLDLYYGKPNATYYLGNQSLVKMPPTVSPDSKLPATSALSGLGLFLSLGTPEILATCLALILMTILIKKCFKPKTRTTEVFRNNLQAKNASLERRQKLEYKS